MPTVVLEQLQFHVACLVMKQLELKFSKRNLLVTYHPVTLEKTRSQLELNNLLQVLSQLRDTTVIFTMPNADPGHGAISNSISDYVDNNNNTYSFSSLGQLKYLSLLNEVDAVVGNSSSGITEVPYFRKGTINIGNRQKGRLKATSIIDCDGTKESIESSLDLLYSNSFQKNLSTVVCPYGKPGSSKKIYEIIKNVSLSKDL